MAWTVVYNNLFLCEYYLTTKDAQVLPGIKGASMYLAQGVNRVTNNIFGLPLTTPLRGHLSLETGPLNGTVVKNNIFLTASADQKDVSEIRIHGTGRKARLTDTDSDNNIYYCAASPFPVPVRRRLWMNKAKPFQQRKRDMANWRSPRAKGMFF